MNLMTFSIIVEGDTDFAQDDSAAGPAAGLLSSAAETACGVKVRACYYSSRHSIEKDLQDA